MRPSVTSATTKEVGRTCSSKSRVGDTILQYQFVPDTQYHSHVRSVAFLLQYLTWCFFVESTCTVASI